MQGGEGQARKHTIVYADTHIYMQHTGGVSFEEAAGQVGRAHQDRFAFSTPICTARSTRHCQSCSPVCS